MIGANTPRGSVSMLFSSSSQSATRAGNRRKQETDDGVRWQQRQWSGGGGPASLGVNVASLTAEGEISRISGGLDCKSSGAAD